jgi:hypothetical protein
MTSCLPAGMRNKLRAKLLLPGACPLLSNGYAPKQCSRTDSTRYWTYGFSFGAGSQTNPLSGERRVLPTGRKRELKSRAWTVVRDRPEPAAVPINDGTTDRQPQPQTTWFGRMESIKDSFGVQRIKTDP